MGRYRLAAQRVNVPQYPPRMFSSGSLTGTSSRHRSLRYLQEYHSGVKLMGVRPSYGCDVRRCRIMTHTCPSIHRGDEQRALTTRTRTRSPPPQRPRDTQRTAQEEQERISQRSGDSERARRPSRPACLQLPVACRTIAEERRSRRISGSSGRRRFLCLPPHPGAFTQLTYARLPGRRATAPTAGVGACYGGAGRAKQRCGSRRRGGPWLVLASWMRLFVYLERASGPGLSGAARLKVLAPVVSHGCCDS
ncbi:hypothetical protein OH77DRAFT_267410 [Trametes cingulata]|nr:hypothetical protein OH77DRAFT_267410 [Trametes cingulata]